MKRVLLILSLLAFTFTSCIREDIPECGSLKIKVEVKDKNYFNVDFAHKYIGDVERIDETLPFKDYVPSIYYKIESVATGEIMESSLAVLPITGNESVIDLGVCGDFPYGDYIVTIWGGLDDESLFVDGDDEHVDLAKAVERGCDVYLARKVIHYEMAGTTEMLSMERTMGKLYVVGLNVEGGYNHFETTTTKINSEVFSTFEATNERSFDLNHSWDGSPSFWNSTLLPLTLVDESSIFNMTLFKDGVATKFLDKLPIELRRNEITAVRVVKREDGGDTGGSGIDLYVLINDKWDYIHNMIIE